MTDMAVVNNLAKSDSKGVDNIVILRHYTTYWPWTIFHRGIIERSDTVSIYSVNKLYQANIGCHISIMKSVLVVVE